MLNNCNFFDRFIYLCSSRGMIKNNIVCIYVFWNKGIDNWIFFLIIVFFYELMVGNINNESKDNI